jgi:hypothetical protein
MAPERSKKIVTKKINRVYKTVNKLTSYEQLISEKILQVPVPDMSSGIWGQIEQALDRNAPGNSNDEHAPENPGGGAYPGSAHYFYIAGCFIIGVIIFVIVATQRRHAPTPNQPERNPPKQEITPSSSGNIYSDSNKNNNENSIVPGSPLLKTNDSGKTVLLPFIRSTIDSVTNLPILTHDRDSMNLIRQGLTIQPRPDSFGQVPFIPIKKPRGVTGISDSDYKIKGVKKDSTR